MSEPIESPVPNTGEQENPARLPANVWPPGQSGNPKSRPPGRGTEAEFRREMSAGMLQRVAAVWDRVDAELKNPEAEPKWTKLAIEHGFGRPRQTVEVGENVSDVIAEALGRAHENGFEALRLAALARAKKAQEDSENG